MLGLADAVRGEQERRIAGYLGKFGVVDEVPDASAEYEELLEIRVKVLEVFKRADFLAQVIREKSKRH